jgi:Terminase small subunit
MTGIALTPKQEMFCRQYVVDFNGQQAAIRAGYSPRTARSQASRLLTYANVQRRITELRDELHEKLDKTAGDVLAEVAKVGFVGSTRVVTTADKLRALDMLGKHLGLWEGDGATRQETESATAAVIKAIARMTPEERAQLDAIDLS